MRDEFVSWRRISLDRKWGRKFHAGLQFRAVENFIKLGRLIQEEVTHQNDASGKKKKNNDEGQDSPVKLVILPARSHPY